MCHRVTLFLCPQPAEPSHRMTRISDLGLFSLFFRVHRFFF
jgi:hypothetical protein